jgi:hypothetical protein
MWRDELVQVFENQQQWRDILEMIVHIWIPQKARVFRD